ncbi:MAG: hypothetical protein NZM25_10935 [Leptospiraceae bacterium]|nr:hypothetical protein [Leptospiraceae bacterium]MDW8305944.1 hypothetical protein [Leptospiraceae bacterium]
MRPANSLKLSVRELRQDREGVKTFVEFSRDIYRDNPYYVHPIYAEQVRFILKGPFNRIGEKILLMAWRGERPVARASFHRSFAHNEYYKTNQGFFGWFEAYDDVEAVAALMDAGENWLKQRGCTSMIGPMNFTIYDEIGILMDAYDKIPAILCLYNPPYYPRLLEQVGFVKEIDWYAYWRDKDAGIPPLMEKVWQRFQRNEKVKIRPANMKKWNEEIRAVKNIFNEAWKENWGHVPFNDEQWENIVRELKRIVIPELALILEAEGKPVGFCITIPDANYAIKFAEGRLFPFGIFKILWHLRKVKTTRTIIMGLLPEYRRHGYDFALVYRTIVDGIRLGYTGSDCSLLAETNTRIIEGVKAMGAYHYKTYRLFRRDFRA